MTATAGARSKARKDADPAGEDVHLAARGDAAAFERLVVQYQDDAVNTAFYFLGNYEDALDVSQEAFLKAYRGLSGFRGGSSFKTWILTITLNCARSLRARRRTKKRSAKVVRIHRQEAGGAKGPGGVEIDIPDPDVSSRPQALVERKEIKEALEGAICELEETSRQVVVLRDIAGESYESISEALGVPLGTVKSRVHRARLELQAKLTPWL